MKMHWSTCYNCSEKIYGEENSVKLEIRLRLHPANAKLSKEICHECFRLIYNAIPNALDKHSLRLSVRPYGTIKTNRYSLRKLTLNDSIEELRLETRAFNCLSYFKISTIGQLLEISKEQFLSIKNLGPKGRKEIIDALLFYGFINPFSNV